MADYKSGWTGSEIDAGIQAAINALPKSGGTMTGALTLNGTPTSDNQAATKKYVDDAAAKALPKSGGTMTGALTLNGAPTSDLHAATKKYVDDAVANGGDNAIADKAPAQHAEQHSYNDTLTWDGDETGRTVAVIHDDESSYTRLVHVSDVVLSMDNLVNGVFSALTFQNGTIAAWEEAPENFIEQNGVLFGGYIYIVSEENCTLEMPSVTFPKKGIYLIAITDHEDSKASHYCSSITIPGYNFADFTDPITPEMISAAPGYHASESSKHGVGTANKYGHLKIANLGDVFTAGEEDLLDLAIELPVGDPSIDLEPYAFGAYLGWSMTNFFWNCFRDNSEMIDSHNTQINTLQNQTLKQTDRQNIINDALTALAGADPNNATAAVVENLSGMTSTLQRKVTNMAEDISQMQQELNELEISYVEIIVRVVCRLIHIERTLNLQPPISTEGMDTTTEIDSIYDNTDWQ